MKIHNAFRIEALLPRMQAHLDAYRTQRNFDAQGVIRAKVARINTYFAEYGLTAAVVAVSGGIDSALVLALLNRAAQEPGSPITRLVPVTLPAKASSGATGQDSSEARALELCTALGLKTVVLDISPYVTAMSEGVQNSVGMNGEDWAMGQLVAYTRTPLLYYYTTLLTEQGSRAVLVGTTNADEGQYIGYLGKASDGMVDIQLISDLHKSEVYSLSRALGVPDSILDVAPTGDMFDGRPDEEVFGAPYGFIELYRWYLCLDATQRDTFMADLRQAGEEDVFMALMGNVENMHRYNKHKYLGCSPAVHLDVLDTKVLGGWKYFGYGA